MSSLKPVNVKGRIEHIDVIRGIAVLGILFVNMAHFSYPDLYLSMMDADNFITANWGKLDKLVKVLLNIFVQMKFIFIFSFLFGFGMILMMFRADEKGQKFAPLYLRRLAVLFLFGVIHSFLLWDGDILMDYALLGFILFLFRKCRPKVFFISAILLYLLFSVPTILYELSSVGESEQLAKWQVEMMDESEQNAKQALAVYSEGTFTEIATQRVHDRIYYMSINGMVSLNPIIYFFANIPYFSMFLLGAYFAKRKILHHPKKYNKLLKKLMFISVIIGLPSNILFGIFHYDLFILIGAPFLAVFYIVTIVFLFNSPVGKKLLKPLKAVGRMALTNYILQSVIATTIFYNYGFGLYGKIGPFVGLIFTISIVIFQIVFSNYWFKKFQFGPLEWLWRKMTYLRL